MRKFFTTFLLSLVLFSSFPAFAEDSDFKWYGLGEPFQLSKEVDIPIIAVCAGIYFPTLIYEEFFNSTDISYTGTPLNKEDINGFDRMFLCKYNKPLDIAADVVSLSVVGLPLIFATVPKDDWITIGVMYLETYVLTRGIKETLKLSLNRARPYMYFENPPQKEIDREDWYLSFPSGHTAYAFATAAFSTYLLNQYYPDAKWKYAVIGGSFALAAADGVLRVLGGCHFTTDVLVGAVLGTGFGFLVPWLHTLNTNKDAPVTITPLGFNVSLHF